MDTSTWAILLWSTIALHVAERRNIYVEADQESEKKNFTCGDASLLGGGIRFKTPVQPIFSHASAEPWTLNSDRTNKCHFMVWKWENYISLFFTIGELKIVHCTQQTLNTGRMKVSILIHILWYKFDALCGWIGSILISTNQVSIHPHSYMWT